MTMTEVYEAKIANSETTFDNETKLWPFVNLWVRCFSLYNYYPKNRFSDNELDPLSKYVRERIWDFKAAEFTTEASRRLASEFFIDKVEEVLKYFFKDRLSELTLFCIPASSKSVNQRRYGQFSRDLCARTGMTNAFEAVDIVQDGAPKHLHADGKSTQAKIQLDANLINGKNIILFDDVVTKGNNMKAYFDFLTSNYNCKVLGGITLGRTEHEYHKTHPIEDILGTEEKPQTENKSIMDFFKDIYRC